MDFKGIVDFEFYLKMFCNFRQNFFGLQKSIDGIGVYQIYESSFEKYN